ncbi:MAG: succinate dehydrogenase assembly factor 2 [Nevskiales bacterium]
MSDKSRLRWKCRRGMKELDVLLTRFLETQYDALDAPLQYAFVTMLEMEDPDLYACLMGQQEAPTAQLKDVIESIRG